MTGSLVKKAQAKQEILRFKAGLLWRALFV
jgi:hypothetical protein